MLYTQETRFIKIDSPLGSDVLLLKSLSGSEAISNLFNFRLELLSKDPSLTYDDIVGQNVTLTIRTIDGGERYFNGFISKFSQSGSDEDFTTYNAEMVPWLWFLTLTSDCRIFQNMTVPEIIEKIFSDLGFSDFKNELQGSFRKWLYCVQYRETDFNFVSRLMEQEGIFYFFKHEQGKHILVLGNSTNVHKTSEQKQARYYGAADAFLDEDVITGWEMQKEVRPGKYALKDYNFEMPSTSLAANVNGKGEYEIYDYPGEYEQKGDGDSLAKIRLEVEEAPVLVVQGSSTCRGFTTGFTFDLFDHYRDDMNCSYMLTSIRHSASEPSYGRGESSSNGALAYSNSFTCIPCDVPFRPPRITPKPVVQGPQTAVVVGPSGEEIWVDKFGRIKVQFHWDREGKKDENSSCWIRVSQVYAGQKWGSMYIPRIGQEVIVEFLEGDMNQPVITGRVYNAEQMPPFDLPAGQNVSGLKSNSTKGGGGYNEISCDDTKGQEKITIHGQYDMNSTIEHDHSLTVHNNRTITVDGTHTENITGNMSQTVSAAKTETIALVKALTIGVAYNVAVGAAKAEEIGAAKIVTVGANSSEDVGINKSVNAGSNISEGAGKDFNMDAGKKMLLSAGDELTLKCGKATITMKKSGDITIKGAKIMIKGSGDIIIKGKKILEN